MLRIQPHRKYQPVAHKSLLRTHKFVLVPKLPFLVDFWIRVVKLRLTLYYVPKRQIYGFGDLDLKKGVDHDLKLEKGEVWNKI